MRVFAIADLHLSGAQPKPMDVFGEAWTNHWERIKENWRAAIGADDVVLIPGDISWAMSLKDAQLDLDDIATLPGRKVLLRGNHDYWWQSIGRVREALGGGMQALQNDSIDFGEFWLCGSRGWTCEGSKGFTAEDKKIYDREVMRLELSLKSAKGKPILAMTHYPPFNEKGEPSGFTELYEAHGVFLAVYGHLHNRSCRMAFEGTRNGTEYHLVSCDHLNFNPKLVWET